MNFKKLMRGAAMLCAGSILWASCKKENETFSPETNNDVNSSSAKLSGVVPDDPALLAKVPVLTSSDFLADTITNYLSFQPQTEAAKGSGGGRDRTTPTVTITSPGSGAVVSGTVAVQVTATDNVGVSSVVLTADGSVVGTKSAAPFSFSWNTTGLSNGTHTLTATATDAAGNSKAHTIQVGYNTPAGTDITPPSVSITSPVNGSSVSSTISVAVSASDNVGVSNVTLYVDGAVLTSDASAPYSFSLNTATLSSGVHTVSATARDAVGNSNSNAIQVTVNTTVVPPPTSLPSSSVLIMPPVGDQGSEGSCTAFAVGYYQRSAEQYYRTGASSYSYNTNIFSPEFLFNQTELGSNCAGSAILVALNFLTSTGICTWQSSPYTSANGCTTPPTTQQTAEAGNFKIASYTKVYKTDITAIKTMIASKHPLIAQFSIDDSFRNAGPGFIWRSHTTNQGLHAMAVIGYDDSRNAFKVVNQWGTSWGDAGYTWIDYGFFATASSDLFVMNF
jgi:hypothetical protein